MSRVLFLCTGNYYRSRYAEIVFNHHATTLAVPWRADSRGLMVDIFGVFNAGPIASHTRNRLGKLAIACPTIERSPLQLDEADLATATLVVALKEAEHRGMVRNRFPAWEEKIVYWHIDDLGDGPVEEALAGIDREVQALLARLGEAGTHG
jgi:protein-tyrosine phosphatase